VEGEQVVRLEYCGAEGGGGRAVARGGSLCGKGKNWGGDKEKEGEWEGKNQNFLCDVWGGGKGKGEVLGRLGIGGKSSHALGKKKKRKGWGKKKKKGRA